nr:immunoglobulin heavy chain junction region [Macaca mulatta]
CARNWVGAISTSPDAFDFW